jgi:hypothetical protein
MANFADARSEREIDTSIKERTRAKIVNWFIILLGFLLGIVVLFYETILTEAGRFLAPEGRGDAEVSYQNENWWRNRKGVRAFAMELVRVKDGLWGEGLRQAVDHDQCATKCVI